MIQLGLCREKASGRTYSHRLRCDSIIEAWPSKCKALVQYLKQRGGREGERIEGRGGWGQGQARTEEGRREGGKGKKGRKWGRKAGKQWKEERKKAPIVTPREIGGFDTLILDWKTIIPAFWACYLATGLTDVGCPYVFLLVDE